MQQHWTLKFKGLLKCKGLREKIDVPPCGSQEGTITF